MNPSALPPNFVWGSYDWGDGLFVGIIAIALVRPVDAGQWELETNPSWPAVRRVQLFESREEAREHAAAWAIRWEEKLRRQCAWANGEVKD